MRLIKRLVISILFSIGLFGGFFIHAESEMLKIVYYDPLLRYDDIVLEFYDSHNDIVLASFESEAVQIDNQNYITFTSSYIDFEPHLLRLTYSYTLDVEEPPLIEDEEGETTKVFDTLYIDFTLDETFKQEDTYTYYLREGLLFNTIDKLATKIEYATFSSSYVIKFKTNFNIPENGSVKLLNHGDELPVTNLRKIDEYYFFNTDDVNIKFEYMIVIDFLEDTLVSSPIRFDGIYDKGFFTSNYNYLGEDLGALYNQNYTDFKLWAPLQNHLKLNIYDNNTKTTYTMQEGNYGVFSYRLLGNHKDKEYTYSFTRFGIEYELIDPYALLLNKEKTRAVVTSLEETNPFGFRTMEPRSFNGNYLEAIIYESSVHQMTGDQLVYGQYTNTFLGLSRPSTSYNHNGQTIKTGISHLQELGITHLTLNDLFDFSHSLRTINTQYQFVDSITRSISELKTLVKQLNDVDIGLIADINVSLPAIEALEILTPGYYYEHQDGELILDEGIANFNFNNKMVKRYVSSSLNYLVEEFSLAGIKLVPLNYFYTEDLNEIQQTLHQTNNTIIVYGEFLDSPFLNQTGRVSLNSLRSISKIGIMDTRFSAEDHFVSGGSAPIKSYLIKEPVTAFNTYTISQAFNSLPDLSSLTANEQHQAAYMMLLSFGTPIIKAGEEFGYTGEVIKYSNKLYGQHRFENYQTLIDFRKRHVSMRLNEHRDVKNLVDFKRNDNIITMQITNLEDQYPDILIIYNNSLSPYTYTLPIGLNTEEKRMANQGDFDWKIIFSNFEVYKSVYQSEEYIVLKPGQTMILHFGEIKDNIIIPPTRVPEKPQENSNTWLIALIGVGIGIVVIGIIGTYFILKNPKEKIST